MTQLELFRRSVKKIEEGNNSIYQEGQAKHQRKVDHLTQKHCTLEQRMVDVTPRDRWLSFIAQQSAKGIQVENCVPVYGDVCIDQDVALSPENYLTLRPEP